MNESKWERLSDLQNNLSATTQPAAPAMPPALNPPSPRPLEPGQQGPPQGPYGHRSPPTPLSGGQQGHDPNQIFQGGAGPAARLGGIPETVTKPEGAPDPLADATVGITGEGFQTRVNMPSMGLSDHYHGVDELHDELNTIQLGQGKKTQQQINEVLRRAYPDLTDQQRNHMYSSITQEGQTAINKRREFGQSEEGQFQRKFGHMSQAAQDTIRQRQQQQKADQEIFRSQKMAAIAKAQRNPFIDVAPSYGPRNYNRNYIRPHDPRAQQQQ